MGLILAVIIGVGVVAWIAWEAINAPASPDAEKWHNEAEDFRKESR